MKKIIRIVLFFFLLQPLIAESSPLDGFNSEGGIITATVGIAWQDTLELSAGFYYVQLYTAHDFMAGYKAGLKFLWKDLSTFWIEPVVEGFAQFFTAGLGVPVQIAEDGDWGFRPYLGISVVNLLNFDLMLPLMIRSEKEQGIGIRGELSLLYHLLSPPML